MMTLDEAIQHCQEKSRTNSEYSKEHWQLAEWLKELKYLREKDDTTYSIDKNSLVPIYARIENNPELESYYCGLTDNESENSDLIPDKVKSILTDAIVQKLVKNGFITFKKVDQKYKCIPSRVIYNTYSAEITVFDSGKSTKYPVDNLS